MSRGAEDRWAVGIFSVAKMNKQTNIRIIIIRKKTKSLFFYFKTLIQLPLPPIYKQNKNILNKYKNEESFEADRDTAISNLKKRKKKKRCVVDTN